MPPRKTREYARQFPLLSASALNLSVESLADKRADRCCGVQRKRRRSVTFPRVTPRLSFKPLSRRYWMLFPPGFPAIFLRFQQAGCLQLIHNSTRCVLPDVWRTQYRALPAYATSATICTESLGRPAGCKGLSILRWQPARERSISWQAHYQAPAALHSFPGKCSYR